MKQCILPALAIGIVLTGCGGSHPKHSAEAPPEDHAHDDTNPHSEGLSLSLSDGARWEMDEHTRASFVKMTDRFKNLDAPNASQEELVNLGESLQGDLNELIAGCTMAGAAHDELHKYLVHYMPVVNRLKDSGDLEDAKTVHRLLGTYPEYFE